jgi:hypothetical protein
MNSLKWFGYGVLGIFLFAAFINTAFADPTANAGAIAGAQAGSQSGALSQQGQSININSSVPASTRHTQRIDTDTHKIRQNPNVISPDLITSHSQDLCVGSVAAGGSGGGLGLSFGKTIVDNACVRRRDSTLMFNMGMKSAAKERLCDSLRMYAAFQRVGKPCQSRARYDKAVASLKPED